MSQFSASGSQSIGASASASVLPMNIQNWFPSGLTGLISSSVIPFSSCPQTLPASESFPMSQLFASGGQSIGVSALASVLPMNTQDWSPLGWTGGISLQSKGLSRVFSNTTVQKHQFFSAQLSFSHALLQGFFLWAPRETHYHRRQVFVAPFFFFW